MTKPFGQIIIPGWFFPVSELYRLIEICDICIAGNELTQQYRREVIDLREDLITLVQLRTQAFGFNGRTEG